MSTAVQPTQQQPTNAPSPSVSGTSPTSAPSGGSPQGGTTPTTGSAPAEFRYPADYKVEWARGRTPDEVAAIGAQLADSLRGYVQNGTPAQAPQTPASAPQPSDTEYLTRQDAQRYADERFDNVTNNLASMALSNVRSANASIFQKYGPEVDMLLARVDKRLWTVDNLQQVCDIVRGRHVDELAREEAARLVSTMEPTLRSTGATAVPVTPQEQQYTLQSELLTQEQKDKLARAGVNERTIDEWCASTGQSRQQFFESFNRGRVITEAPRR